MRSDIKVLAVDDNAANLKLACILLRDMGLNVTAADSGERAVELARQERFDLILMDLQMPGLDGRAAARRIRLDEQGRPHTPIIALTAHLLPDENQSLRAAGLDDQIVKPISDAEIRAKLARWVDSCQDVGATSRATAPEGSGASARIVDWELGCALTHGNRELAEQMMNLLITTLPRDAAGIVSAWESRDLKQLAAAVHRLNGALRYCGVPRLRSSVDRLESSIKSGDESALTEAMRRFNQDTVDFCTWAEFSRPNGA